MSYTGLYNADGQQQVTIVNGSSYTGLYSPDGQFNGVLNDGVTTYMGRYHPCGAYNVTAVTDPSAGVFAKNGSVNVIASSNGYAITSGNAVAITVPLGLVGYWPFDTVNMNFPGNQAFDVSGNIITGTLANIPGPTVAGKVGQALTFNGTTSSITLVAGGAAANQLPTGTGSFSLCAWIFPTADNDQIILNNDTVGFEQVDFRLNRGSNGKVTIGFLQSDSSTIVCAGTIATSTLVGVWSHVTATGDGTTLRVYVNGALDGSIAYSGIVKDVSGVWAIGRDIANAANPFTGNLDDVRMYKRAITGPEVTAIYNAGLAGKR